MPCRSHALSWATLGHLLCPHKAALSLQCTHADRLLHPSLASMRSHCGGLINALDPQPCCVCDLCNVRHFRVRPVPFHGKCRHSTPTMSDSATCGECWSSLSHRPPAAGPPAIPCSNATRASDARVALEQPRFFLAVLPLLNSSLAPERRSSHCGAGSMPSTPNLASVSVCTNCSRACSSCPRMTFPSGILSACSSLLRAHFELQPRHAWENRLAPNHARHSCTAARDIGSCGCFVNQIFMHSPIARSL
jgi:hypothetical protein